MQIIIEFDSIWQNSFLSGVDSKPLSMENKRTFKASSKSQGQQDVKKICKSTVLGVLCRLIGHQEKLFQIRKSKDYFFKEIEDSISFNICKEQVSEDNAFIINKNNDRPAQSSFVGVISDTAELFFSESAPQLWSVLYLNFVELLDFLLSSSVCEKTGSSMPLDLSARIDEISDTKKVAGLPVKTVGREIQELSLKITKAQQKQNEIIEKFQSKKNFTAGQKEAFEKKQEKYSAIIHDYEKEIIKIQTSKERREFDDKLNTVVAELSEKYPDLSYLQDGILYRIRLYSAALYFQAERMLHNNIQIDYCLNSKKGICIPGFSKRGFNGVRDLFNRFAGSKKKTVGTPFPLTKANGQLEIKIAVNREKGEEIKRMIDDARVSCFYLGKKGLAYVTNIDTEETQC